MDIPFFHQDIHVVLVHIDTVIREFDQSLPGKIGNTCADLPFVAVAFPEDGNVLLQRRLSCHLAVAERLVSADIRIEKNITVHNHAVVVSIADKIFQNEKETPENAFRPCLWIRGEVFENTVELFPFVCDEIVGIVPVVAPVLIVLVA